MRRHTGSIEQFSIKPDHCFRLSANHEKRYHQRQIGSYRDHLGLTLRRQKETIMREMFPSSIIMVAIAAAGAVIATHIAQTEAQTPPASRGAPAPTTLNTPWGEPDLQGIWTDETDTLLQRSARYADQEFFTEAQRAELDRERSEVLGRDKRGERGTELDLAGAYNSAFVSWKRVGVRTSLIVDPPNGRIPSLTPEAQKIAAAEREYRLALLQATDACKTKAPICSGGKYDPTPSPRRTELPPRFSTGGMNRSDGPEDSSLAERCLTGGRPGFGGGIGFRSSRAVSKEIWASGGCSMDGAWKIPGLRRDEVPIRQPGTALVALAVLFFSKTLCGNRSVPRRGQAGAWPRQRGGQTVY